MFKQIRPGVYQFRVTYQRNDKRATIKGIKSEKEARMYEARLTAELQKDVESSLKDSSEIKTFRQAYDRYFKDNPGVIWGEYVQKKVLEYFGNSIISDAFTTEFLEKLNTFTKLPTRYKKLPSDSTRNKFVGLPKAIINHCYKLDLITKDYLKLFARIKEDNERTRYIIKEEYEKLYAAISPTFQPIMQCAYRIGARSSELCKLRRTDINLIERKIIFRKEITKARKERKVPIPQEMLEYFRDLPGEAEWVFYIPGTFRQIGRHSLRCAFHRAATAAKIEDVRFRDLRATCATDLHEKGVPKKFIMELLGHVTERMFLRYQKIKDFGALDAAINGRSANDPQEGVPRSAFQYQTAKQG